MSKFIIISEDDHYDPGKYFCCLELSVSFFYKDNVWKALCRTTNTLVEDKSIIKVTQKLKNKLLSKLENIDYDSIHTILSDDYDFRLDEDKTVKLKINYPLIVAAKHTEDPIIGKLTKEFGNFEFKYFGTRFEWVKKLKNLTVKIFLNYREEIISCEIFTNTHSVNIYINKSIENLDIDEFLLKINRHLEFMKNEISR